ncbi:MAG: DNA mismatch repair protein MutL, partial [Opitutales bacterium]|nr:DNA mismatch repair protein MutL [Opitutales bacterium]
AEAGAEILVEGGKYRHCREVGMPAGTRIEISGLFFNVPARLKFLKTENTEAAHITRCVRLYAVAHPEIAFTLWENGREIFRSPAGPDLRARVGAIWGRQLSEDLIPLCESEGFGMRVRGLVGKPGVSRTSRAEMVTIVNGRPVDNRTMAYSLVESFHTLIPRGRYPIAFLFLDIDPHAVDVNVHPAKREVRFRNESAVRNLIISAVLKTVGSSDEEPDSPPVPAISPGRFSEISAPAGVSAETAPEKSPQFSPQAKTVAPSFPAAKNIVPAQQKTLSVNSVPVRVAPLRETPSPVSSASAKPAPAPVVSAVPAWTTWRFIGRFDGLALFQVEKNLLVLNPRLALERIWYERALERFRKAERRSQILLIPEPIEFEPVLSDALLQNMETLNEAGFCIEEFGRNFFRIIEVPDWLSLDADVKQCVRDLVDRIARLPAEFSRGNVAHETLAHIAASHALQGREEIKGESDLRELLTALFASSQPNVSPNGQKIFFEISRAELNRRFS